MFHHQLTFISWVVKSDNGYDLVNYHYLLCNNPKEQSTLLPHCGSLKSQEVKQLYSM
jgi:hypothetical protein